MVSPEDLSVEHSRELARNRTDMRFMEDDEEWKKMGEVSIY